MPQEINISDADIEYAEKILLPEGKEFDKERRLFIRNLSTLDLQAVPGSGKTTALLAKLLILERYMPLKDSRGVLIISHTNAAVDEIKEQIGKHCPKLFAYPNFLGTIQSFVNTFLAIPFYTNKLKKRPLRIDSEIYNEVLANILSKPWFLKFNTSDDDFKKILHLKNVDESLFYNLRLGFCDNRIILKKGLNGKILQINKPKRGKSYQDYTELEKSNLYNWFMDLKLYLLMQKSVLHYDDAYFLANYATSTNPHISKLLQKRFKYVFVDEMQDMDIHQYELIEKVFYPNENTESVIQRIGDKNQAIYNGGSIHLDNIWSTRENILFINGSHRLSPRIARLVQNFALTPNSVEGRNKNTDGTDIDIKPIIFVYQNDTKEQVIPAFADKIKELQSSKLIPFLPSHKFMAIAWRKEHDDVDKIALNDYWPNFISANSGQKIDFNVLEDYLMFYEKDKKTLESVCNNILNALLKILRLENITDEHERFYTKRKLINFFKTLENGEYEILKLYLYKWSMESIKGKGRAAIDAIKEYIPSFLSTFHRSLNFSENFINGESENNVTEIEVEPQRNTFESDGISIEIGTIHSAKGQTHTATLYLETYYQKDGKGANAKSYESQRLAGQLMGIQIPRTVGKRVKESSRMAYVGFSRPTHLLCIAIHKDRYDSISSDISEDDWEILKVEAVK